MIESILYNIMIIGIMIAGIVAITTFVIIAYCVADKLVTKFMGF